MCSLGAGRNSIIALLTTPGLELIGDHKNRAPNSKTPIAVTSRIGFSSRVLAPFSCPRLRLRLRSAVMSTSTSTSGSGSLVDAEKAAEELAATRIRKSKLYDPDARDKDPLVYSSDYNIGFMGLEKLHPFDSAKWGRIRDFLVKDGFSKSKFIQPLEATEDDLLVVHTKEYLKSLNRSFNVATIIEVPPVALLPNAIVKSRVLQPFKKQVGGTILAGKLAKERGWAINLGGGFHHCCGASGGGFCVYADITICIQFAFTRLPVSKVMIIDLDAHQGNGHERDFANNEKVYILDMYNRDIYPRDTRAKQAITQRVEITSGTNTEKYLELLRDALKKAKEFQPDFIFYNAGTDVLEGDPLGQLNVTPEGVKERDEIVFRFAREELNKPIVMVISGGYMKTSAEVIAGSIINLKQKNLIRLQTTAQQSASQPTK